MESVRSAIAVLVTVTLLAAGVHVSSLPTCETLPSTISSASLAGDQPTGASEVAGPIDRLDHHENGIAPVCATACAGSAGTGCCGSLVMAIATASAFLEATRAPVADAGSSLSGVEPAIPQEPPQLT